MVIAFVFFRDQFALRYDRHRYDVRAFVEEFGCRIHQHAVLLDNEQKSVLRETGTIWNNEIDGRCKRLHLLGHAGLGTIRHRIDLRFARTDKGDDTLRTDRHVTRIGHDRIEPNMEAMRQLDLLQILFQRRGLGAALRHRRNVRRCSCGLELAKLLQIARIVLCQYRPDANSAATEAPSNISLCMETKPPC